MVLSSLIEDSAAFIRRQMMEIDMERCPALNRSYHCFSTRFLNEDQAALLESGDKIFMPPSALGVLLSQPVCNPMLFQLRNPNAADRELVSHCGVLEFTAVEDKIYIPSWKMKSMDLKDGDVVQVKNVSLPKGKFVKLQPHTKDFLDITNPKAVLEKTLRNFTCFTVGDTIMLPYNGKEYYVNIVETKPRKAISIIETDCEVDFLPPLDYVEPEKPVAVASPSTNKAAMAEPVQIEEPKFCPFSGAGRRLDGKPLPTPQVQVSSSSFVAAANNGKTNAQPSSTGSSSQGTNRHTQGKLVFGSNAADHTTTAPKKIEKQEASKEQAKQIKKEDSKFQPFTGKIYSLKG